MVGVVVDINIPSSYPRELKSLLDKNARLFVAYQNFEHETLSMRLCDDPAYLTRGNPLDLAYKNFFETELLTLVKMYDIFAWHYTRLTVTEIYALQSHGMKISNSDFLFERLSTLETTGVLSSNDTAEILKNSPLSNHNQKRVREGKVYFSSQPLPIDYDGITPFLSTWGGEVTFFWLKNFELKEKLGNIGRPIVIKAAVPLTHTNSDYSAAEAITSFYLDNGKKYDINRHFDLYSFRNLEAERLQIIPAEEFSLQ